MKKALQLICIVVTAFSVVNCSNKKSLTETEVATSWADMTLLVTRKTPANSPTYSSRCLGYLGLTMYESIVQGFPEYQSLEGQLNGLKHLPKIEKGQAYDWVLVLNAAQAHLLKAVYNQTADENKQKIDSLEQFVFQQFSEKVADESTVTRSVSFGKKIAQHIFEWSKTDGGHRGYLQNFDKTLKIPTHAGAWRPPLYAQSFSHFPLHPHWGNNRTFLANDAQLDPPAFILYDTARNSPYYQQFQLVYEKNKALTQAEKEAAIWWSDDVDETFTPPGHSYYLAMIAIKKKILP
jgi:hypothetical protein